MPGRFPDKEDVYASSDEDIDYNELLAMLDKTMNADDESSSDDSVKQNDDEADANTENDENDYIKRLPVEIPGFEDEVLPPELVTDNYIMTYELREPSDEIPEEVFCVSKITAEDFAGKEDLQSIFQKLIRCENKKMISKIKRYKNLVEAIILNDEKNHLSGRETDPHNSLVIAVIDGKTNHMLCGIWCYKRKTGKPMEIHPVDLFIPDGYQFDRKSGNLIKLIPYFED